MTHPQDDFAQPGGGGFLKPAEHDGHLLLVTGVHESFMRFDTLAKADKLNARFDYVCLDCVPQTLHESALSSHAGIASRLQPFAGKGRSVLGRIGQVTTSNGQTAWVLGPFSEGQDDVRARQWLTSQPRQSHPAMTGAATTGNVAPATYGATGNVPPETPPAAVPAMPTGPTPTQPPATVAAAPPNLTPQQVEAMRQLGIDVSGFGA